MATHRKPAALAAFLFSVVPAFAGAADPAPPRTPEYAIVVSSATLAAPAWKEVVAALVDKHGGEVVTYETTLDQAVPALRRSRPRYVCLVATPAEANKGFVVQVHRTLRTIDDDPYTDAIWGILTGFDAANAVAIARQKQPLVVRRALAGTEIALDCCQEGQWYCELRQNHMVRKRADQQPQAENAPDDTTQALVAALNEYQPQLLVTSGHATQRDWQIGYRYRNGQFRSHAGRLSGVDTQGRQFPIASPNPKVYLPVGNCLIGDIDGPDAMTLAFLNSAGVHQMIGYIEPTWYGYMGWGCLDYFVEQPGRFTLAEAFYANNQALIHRLEGQSRGLVSPRPEASLGETRPRGPALSTQDIRGLTFDKTFQPINTNGSQRGGRPIFQLLPHRVRDVVILEGADLHPLVTDNFVLVPLPASQASPGTYRVSFRAAAAN